MEDGMKEVRNCAKRQKKGARRPHTFRGADDERPFKFNIIYSLREDNAKVVKFLDIAAFILVKLC